MPMNSGKLHKSSLWKSTTAFILQGFLTNLENSLHLRVNCQNQGMYTGSECTGCLTSSRGCRFLSPSYTFPIHQRPQEGSGPGGRECIKYYSQKTMNITRVFDFSLFLIKKSQIISKMFKIYTIFQQKHGKIKCDVIVSWGRSRDFDSGENTFGLGLVGVRGGGEPHGRRRIFKDFFNKIAKNAILLHIFLRINKPC